MPIYQIKTVLLLLLIGSLFFSCKTEQKAAKETVEIFKPIPPIPALDPEYATFDFDAAEGGKFTIKSGSTITIPANAFVDADGNSIPGQVSLKYREFHDAASIYLSGIPMGIEVNGVQEHLKTAGMFDIKAEQEGKNLELAEGKSATVRMASYVSGNDYNFYDLDSEGKWQDLGQKDPEVNSKRVKLKKEIDKITPGNKFPLGKKYFTFSFMAFLDVVYNDEIKNADKTMVADKMKAYGVGYSDLYLRKVIDFEGKKIPAGFFIWKNLSPKALPQLAKQMDCNLVEVPGNHRYELTIVDKKKQPLWIGKVEIYMSIKSLLAFPPEYWKNNYETAMASIRQKRETYRNMATVFRAKKVMTLGIYNWDKIWRKDKELLALNAKFDLGEQSDNLMDKEIIFVSGDHKTVVKFHEKDWENLRLIKDKGARMFALLPNQKIMLYSAKKYEKIDFKGLKAQKKPKFVFDMKAEVHDIASADDMRKVLGI